MNRCLNTLFVVLVGAALVGSPPAWAQSEPVPLINLKFPGGTIAEYVAALRETAGETNIVVMPEARDIEMPPIELDSVVLASALELLQGEFQPQERTRVKVEIDEVSRYEEGERPIYRVLAEVHRRGRPSETQVRVWCVADMRDTDTPPEAILTAVETAVGLAADDYEPAQIRFHEATSLIIARGHPEQLEAIEQAVDQLRKSMEMRRQTAREAQEKSLENVHAQVKEYKTLAQDRYCAIQRQKTWYNEVRQERKLLQQENEVLRGKMRGQEARIRELEGRRDEPAEK